MRWRASRPPSKPEEQSRSNRVAASSSTGSREMIRLSRARSPCRKAIRVACLMALFSPCQRAIPETRSRIFPRASFRCHYEIRDAWRTESGFHFRCQILAMRGKAGRRRLSMPARKLRRGGRRGKTELGPWHQCEGRAELIFYDFGRACGEGHQAGQLDNIRQQWPRFGRPSSPDSGAASSGGQ